MSRSVVVSRAEAGKLKQQIEVGGNRFHADVAVNLGGEDAGPDPHELLDAALGACTALTVQMVANRKQMPLQDVRVEITHTEADGVYHMKRVVEFVGELDEAQRQYLLGIANKCPVHRTLHGRFEVETIERGPQA